VVTLRAAPRLAGASAAASRAGCPPPCERGQQNATARRSWRSPGGL